MRPGIQNDLIFRHFPGFPFGFAQGGESFDLAQDREPVERPVEPRVSTAIFGLARSKIPTSSAGNDSFFELRHSLIAEGDNASRMG
jgi:hypothetical protein